MQCFHLNQVTFPRRITNSWKLWRKTRKCTGETFVEFVESNGKFKARPASIMEAVEKLKCFHFFPKYGEKHGEIVLFSPDFHVFPTRRFVVQKQCITVAQQEHTMRYPTVMGAHVEKLVGFLATQKVRKCSFRKSPGSQGIIPCVKNTRIPLGRRRTKNSILRFFFRSVFLSKVRYKHKK